jgi:hypothetical protein
MCEYPKYRAQARRMDRVKFPTARNSTNGISKIANQIVTPGAANLNDAGVLLMGQARSNKSHWAEFRANEAHVAVFQENHAKQLTFL